MIRETMDYYGGSIAPAFGAVRFDTAGRNVALLIGQAVSTRWISQDLGMDWVEERINQIAGYTHQRLSEMSGVAVVTPREALAGLIAFNVDGITGPDLTKRLADEHNVTIRFVTKYINNPDAARVSLGFFNIEEDVDRFIDGVTAIQGSL